MGAFNNVILLTDTNETNPKDIISFIVFVKIIINLSSVSPTRM